MPIRSATAEDAARIAAIYAPYVEDSVASFEIAAPDAQEMAQRINRSLEWLVAELDGSVVGYAYAGPFAARAAYQWSVEVSIYLDQHVHGRGLGGQLLDALLEQLEADGYANAFAGVTLPNAASQGLFESRGFDQTARFRQVGFKRDAWHDVGWWQRQLRAPAMPPP